MARRQDSQNSGKPAGKVYRIKPDGSIPKDNPYAGKTNMLQAIFSIGNRNVHGIAQHPTTGEIWATEHGPMGGDELNILKKGANYGWPTITYGVDYDNLSLPRKNSKREWNNLSRNGHRHQAYGARNLSQENFPLWKNNLLVGKLAFEEIRRLTIDNHNVIEEEIVLKGVVCAI